MFIVFTIYSNVLVSKHLNISGDIFYNIPYSWIICLIVPVLGWSLFCVMYIYLVLLIPFKLRLLKRDD